MIYPRSNQYDERQIRAKIMGPNPLKLLEELLAEQRIPRGGTEMDLGCGQGLTSVFLVREYGFRVFATDLWSDPADNRRFFEQMGLTPGEIVPIRADAAELPYAREFFDGIISVDAYHYFGREPGFLEKRLLPFIKPGGYLYIAVPGMKRDCHADLPPELLLSWSPEDLDSLHDAKYWRRIIGRPEAAAELRVREMASIEEVWRDWLACDNEYAAGDRKAMEAGGDKYLNFIAITLRKKG